MGISVPPAINYQSPLVALPTRWDQPPNEGSKIIPVEVDWATMGGTSNTVAFNLQNNATLEFSQIVAISIDNSACGADIQFIFPDTSETLSIPAYSPKIIVPVFTNQRQFWLTAPNAESEDITRFALLNSLPPPIAVPTTQEQNFDVFINTNVAGSSNTQLLAAAINGTLENISVNFCCGGDAGVSNFQWTIQDGNSNVIAGGQVRANANQNTPQLSLNDLRVRFQSGLKLIWTNSGNLGVNAVLPINLYYRTP